MYVQGKNAPFPHEIAFTGGVGMSQMRASARDSRHASLLQLDLRTSVFKLLLNLFSFVLRHIALHLFGSALNEVFRFLEAEASDGADFLNDVDLLVTGGCEHDGEFGLFDRCRGSRGSAWSSGHRHRGGGRDAPFVFQKLGQLGCLENRQLREFVDQLLEICHSSGSYMVVIYELPELFTPLPSGHRP